MKSPSGSHTRENWLQEYLSESVRKRLCTQISCTTCGALEFRRGLLASIPRTVHRPNQLRLDRDAALAIARALAHVRPSAEDESWKFEDAIRFILLELWRTIGQGPAEREFEPILAGTWSGDVLARMQAHHRAREAARRAHAETQDPVLVQHRREEKRRLRQQKHAERLALKKERDRLWREQHAKESQ